MDLQKDIFIDVCSYVSKVKEPRIADDINKARKYIEDNFSSPISLKDVADKVYRSHAYFCTLFKKKNGKSFYSYLTQVRMEEAAKLLKSCNYSVKEIAIMVGYKNSRIFSDAFKRYYGVIPSQYCERTEFVSFKMPDEKQ